MSATLVLAARAALVQTSTDIRHMAQISHDSFLAAERPMRVDEAAALLFKRIEAVGDFETIDVAEADGRTLAEDLAAPLDLPGFDNSAVDGYALRHADLTPGAPTVLPIRGRAAAGHAADGADAVGGAVRIFTGAPMPQGSDTVVMQEDCRLGDAGRVVVPGGLPAGANRRLRGEDLCAGAPALARGRRLRPEDLGLAAALGFARLNVTRRLRAAIFSTGDELVAPGAPLAPPRVYDANRFLLHGLLRRQGVDITDLGILRDDPAATAAALRRAAAAHDLIVTSGGVSTGEEDYVRAAAASCGALAFWRLAVKPGRSVAMGAIEGAAFVGLPGNPVAAFVTFLCVARPLIAALSGGGYEPPRAFEVRSGFSYAKKAGRREYVRASLIQSPAGVLQAEKYRVEGAAVLTSLTRTDGLVELAEDTIAVAPGETVHFIPYDLAR